MRALNALLWQVALVLLLMYAGLTTIATLATGCFLGFWFCVIQLALMLGEELQ